jgi:hypothetical protein
MNDTSDSVEATYRRRFDAYTPIERARMGFQMFEFSRTCARLGIRHDHPELTDSEVEQRLFLRMYGDELPPNLLRRGLERIARDRAVQDAAPASR